MPDQRVTKYVLLGGFATRAADGGAAFCNELVSGLRTPVRICECLFALPAESWEQAIVSDVELFRNAVPERIVEFACAEVVTFVHQIENADIVYFRGGSTKLLLLTLSSIEGWKEALKGKTVAGSSAGACMLSQYYFDTSEPDGMLHPGVGLVPVKVTCHYKAVQAEGHRGAGRRIPDWDRIDTELALGGGDGAVVKLREGEFRTFWL